MLFLLTTSIASYIEKLLLAQYSEEAFAGSLNGFALAKVFQASTLAVVISGQAFVGLFHGGNQPKQIGPCIWQLIWFSLGTALVVPTFGFAIVHLFYQNTPLFQSASSYFSLLCWFNFLYPLAGALSAFYIARGKMALVVSLTIAACFLNIGLDYILIFGTFYSSPMGSTGAALAKVISQGVLCLALGFIFLSRKNKEEFNTSQWALEPRLFYHYIKPGVLRGLGAFVCLADWSFVTRTMSVLSEHHSRIFGIGNAIFYFFTFFADALFQSMVTVTSNYIGKKQSLEIRKIVLSAMMVLFVFCGFLTIPFFVFPETLMICFKTTCFSSEIVPLIQLIAPWIWISLIGYGLNLIGLGLVTAFRDAFFLFGFYCCTWSLSAVPIYVAMAILGWSADKFWLLFFLTNSAMACVLFRRASRQNWLGEQLPPASFPEVPSR